MKLEDFPIVIASLNGASAVLLVIGYVLIRLGKWRAHAVMMISAVVTSAVFLVFYLTYHHLAGIRYFPPIPIVHPIYITILTTHTILAMVILPLVLITLYRASRRQWSRHRRIARITLPIWIYVSVTGVVVYWMLYRLAPHLATPPAPVANLIANHP